MQSTFMSRRVIECVFPLLAFMVLALGPNTRAAEPHADLLLLHGHIYTANPRSTLGAGRCLRGGKSWPWARTKKWTITAAAPESSTWRADGYARHHRQPSSFSRRQPGAPAFALDDLYTVASIKQRIKEFAAAHPDEAWLLGRGWLYDAFKPSGLPDKKILDEIVPDRPVVVDCYDGHSIWVNSKALALAHITRARPRTSSDGATVVGNHRPRPRHG